MNTNHKNQVMSKAADTAKSVHLSASAGSGKTRALKERYLALLDRLDRSSLGLDQAVAITFTDKAAAEIKERVMQDLPEALLKKVIRGRQDLRISTIHSFCMNLLKRYPLDAGLPPDFGVLDERDRVYKVRRAIEDALEEADRDPGIMAPLRDFTADELIERIDFLISIRSRLKRMEIDAGGPEKLFTAFHTGLGTEQTERTMKKLIEGPDWRALFMQMELLLRSQGDCYEECNGSGHRSLAATNDIPAAYRLAESLMPVYFTQKGEPRKKPPIARAKYRPDKRFPYAVYETLSTQIQDVLAPFTAQYRLIQAGREALSLLRLYLRAEGRYQEAKLREGLLDFDDLEVSAYRLLKSQESPDILYWLDRKILHFLVDEFQDTSDIQWAVLERLTEELFAGQGADKPMPATLFVVGDEKQSIYRFREANYRLLENVRAKMERNIPPGSREVLTLDKNFRSTPEIIDTVNQVFSALWGEGYQPSETDRKQHRGSVRLLELLPGSPEGAADGFSEAAVLAQEIRKVVSAETVVYEKDGDAWKERPAGYGDCAVLIQSRTRLKEYEAALQAKGIPYRVVGGIGFYEEDEIQAVMNVLFFLWNRDDKLALAAALKSPLFGLTDQDILAICFGCGDMPEVPEDGKGEARKLLDTWRRTAGVEPLSGLIHRIIRDTGAYLRFGRQNPQAIFNLDKLLDRAREFDRRGYTTLQDFVEWVRNIREAEQREATADMNLPGFQGAVSIMTVHKAKGLEFPIVFLPGMHQQPRSVATGPLALIEEDSGSIRMAIKDAASPLYDEMWGREQEELKREHQRLLYVAMTRARDHLVMTGNAGNEKTAKQTGWLNYLHRAIPAFPAAGNDSRPGIVFSAYPDWQGQRVPVQEERDRQAEPQERKPEVTVDGKAVLRNLTPIPAPAAAEWKKATDYISEDKEWSLEQPFARQTGTVSSLIRGSILHRCLEDRIKNGAYDLERVTKELPEVQALDKEGKEAFLHNIESVLRSVTGNRDLAWIFEGGPNAYAELPFLYQKGRELVSGVIDRVIAKEDRGFVIDYKAIPVESDEERESWINHYRPQIRIYCEAVKELFKLSSVEGYLLFLDSSRLVLAVRLS